MKLLSLFLLLSILPNVALCGVGGQVDKRKVIGWIGEKPSYVSADTKNIWNTYPYNEVVAVKGSWGATGTGTFISPKHVLTNTHVAKGCGLEGQTECTIYLSDMTYYPAKVVAFGGTHRQDEVYYADWSILEITDKNFCKKDYMGFTKTVPSQGLWRAGFGGLRVLTSEDIKNIKKSYEEWLKKVYPHNFIIRKLDATQGVNLHWGKYDIHDSDNDYYKTFLETFKKLTGTDFLTEYLEDGLTLKLIRNCGISHIYDRSGYHNCQSWAGDSGSSVIRLDNQIILLNRGGDRFVTSKDEYINVGPLTQNIFTKKTMELIENAKKQCEEKKEINEEKKEINNERIINEKCTKDDLPRHAIAGRYVLGGIHHLNCVGNKECSCAALMCESGYYLVVNAKTGKSQGWCIRAIKCPDGQHMNIIDGYKTDKTCVDNEPEINDYDDKNNVNNTETSATNDTPVNSGENTNTIKPAEPAVSGGGVNAGSISNTINNNDETPVSTPVPEQRPNIGDACEKSDLPAYATDGHYIKSGIQKLNCANGVTCSCAATRCKPNYYLMVNDKGLSQGWCRSSSCPNGKQLHIIDGYKTDGCK